MFCEVISMAPSAAFTMCPSEVIDHRSVNMEASQEGNKSAKEITNSTASSTSSRCFATDQCPSFDACSIALSTPYPKFG